MPQPAAAGVGEASRGGVGSPADGGALMRRFDRARFVAFGILPLLNALALALHGLNLSTHGSNPQAGLIPLLMVLIAACLLGAMLGVLRRGRDLGWHPAFTIVAFWVTLGMGPVLLALAAYLALAKSAVEPPPPAPTAAIWAWAVLAVLAPWVVFFATAALRGAGHF